MNSVRALSSPSSHQLIPAELHMLTVLIQWETRDHQRSGAEGEGSFQNPHTPRDEQSQRQLPVWARLTHGRQQCLRSALLFPITKD